MDELKDGIIGDLTEEEAHTISSLQTQADVIYSQIGQVEARIAQLNNQKKSLIDQSEDISHKGQQAMNNIADRLQIQSGTKWQITRDRKVQVVS